MPKPPPPAMGLTLQYLRSAHGWSPQELAAALGQDKGLIRKYEKGDKTLTRETLEATLAPLRHEPLAVDVLDFAHRLISPAPPAEAGSPLALTAEERRQIDRMVLAAAWTVAEELRAELVRWQKAETAAAERRRAVALCDLLKGHSAADRRDLIAVFPELRSWAVVERLCDLSERAAAHKPSMARELADLALYVAGHRAGEEPWRRRAQGYALGFIANAQRVANDFAAADATFARAWELWRSGSAAEPDLFPEWRLLDLEASLRRAQQRFAEALELLDRAKTANATGSPAAGRLLLKKSHVLEQMEDSRGALAALEEAAPALEAAGDPQLLFGLRFNTAANYCQLEDYAAADDVLPEVRRLAVEQADELSLTRVLWLEGRVAAGQGRVDEALAALEQVQRELTVRALPYDAALSSLDLAVLWLQQGRTAEVRLLAVGMAWIFKAKGVHQKALAALALFCEAARQEAATVELARRVITDVEKVRRSTAPGFLGVDAQEPQ